jgi:hypothetical protein
VEDIVAVRRLHIEAGMYWLKYLQEDCIEAHVTLDALGYVRVA